MGYENAPSTLLLATHCACCGRALRDAVSVERGVGPDCAEKYGYTEAQQQADWTRVETELCRRPDLGLDTGTFDCRSYAAAVVSKDARGAANTLVHQIACLGVCPSTATMILLVDALGYSKLAATLADRLGAVHVSREGDLLVVDSPRSDTFLLALRKLPGRRFDRERKVNIVPVQARRELWDAIRWSFPAGTVVIGERVTILGDT